MSITPNDILNKEFGKKFRGYDDEEVNDFLDLVVVDYERAVDAQADLQQRLDAAEEKLQRFEQLQESLNSSILIANEAAERLKQNARKEAELIIYEAERESERIIGSAHETVHRLTNDIEILRHNGRHLQSELQRMLSQQLEFVTNQTFDTEFQIEQAAPAAYREEASHRSSEIVAELEREVQVTEPVTPTLDEVAEETIPDLTETPVQEEPAVESILGQTIKIELPEDL